MVGIDGSPASELATAIAFDEASWRGVDLVALHAFDDTDVRWVMGRQPGSFRIGVDLLRAQREGPSGWSASNTPASTPWQTRHSWMTTGTTTPPYHPWLVD